MKKLFLIPLISLFLVPPKETTNVTNTATYNLSIKRDDCGSYKGKKLNRGPRGGCYYINKNGNKTYVDRSLCKC